MKVAIDLQGCQNLNNRNRGIGRYSLALIKALIEEYRDDHYILLANANLQDIESDFEQELSNLNLKVDFVRWYYPTENSINSNKHNFSERVGSYLYGYTLSNISADVILVTSFFEGFEDDSIIKFDDTFDLPVVACVFYDLIPFLNPDLYLETNQDYKTFYLNKIKELKDIDLYLAISESAAFELENTLDLNRERIVNISSACNNNIFDCSEPLQDKFYSEIDIIGNFILYAGAADPRKNLKNLIQSYSLLPKGIRDDFKLVLAGKYTSAENFILTNYIKQLGFTLNDVILTGYVSDEKLVYLYKKCTVFVMPSFHEGFGLPALEAMSCGAAVIASNTTSLPEVLGNELALFAPNNPLEMSLLLKRCLSDFDFLNSLKEHSIKQSKLFTWRKTAINAYSAINRFAVNTESSNLNLENSWLRYTQKRNLNFLKLIRKIDQDFGEYVNYSVKDTKLVSLSSCIDLINKSIDTTYRKLSSLSHKLSWKLEGPFDSNYSLSILNQNLAFALKSLDHDVSINITEGNGDYPIDYRFLEKHTNISEIHKRSIKDSLSIVNSRNMYPPRVSDSNSRINILHAYGWEETQINYHWINDFNESLQGITVMSEFVKKILIDNGFSKPIFVCGLGVDHVGLNKVKFFPLTAKKFKFIHVSSCFPRKGAKILLEAYKKNFSSSDNVSLVIKTFSNPHNNIKSLIDDYRVKDKDFPDVVYIDSDLTKEEIVSLYSQCDALVAPSYGEGFGLPIAEAMFLKIPVITTGWGGQCDFCNSENAWLIDYQFKFSESHFGLSHSVWAEPSVDHLARLMHDVFSSSSEKLIEKTEKAFNLISSRYVWKNVAQSNVNFVHNLISMRSFRPSKIGWITTWNSRCGIAAYSKHLVEYFSDDIIILAPHNESLISTDSFNVRRCWDLDYKDNQSFAELYQVILNENFTSLVIQFNYGFFNFKELENLICLCRKNDIRLIIMMHSTIDPIGKLFKNLKIISSSLQFCDRILVHTPKDLNRLKNISLEKNVALFPHGIVDFSPLSKGPIPLGDKQSDFIVSTFGYCLPNKGFPELIRAVRKLADQKLPIKLKMFTALYDKSFNWFYKDLVDLVNMLEISDLVDININYLPEDKTLLALSNSDLIVFPYQNTNESSSAAVRQGIASGTPVAVTPLHIFDDVMKVVKVLPGTTIEDIAVGIDDFYSRTHKGNHLPQVIDSHMDWINQHSFSNLSVRLQGIVRGLENNFSSN